MQFVHSPYLGYTTSNNGSQQSSTNQPTNPQGLPYAPLDQQLNYHQQPTPGVQHHQQQQPQPQHPGYPGGYAPQQMLSQNDSSSTGGGPVKPKRKQVKNACGKLVFFYPLFKKQEAYVVLYLFVITV